MSTTFIQWLQEELDRIGPEDIFDPVHEMASDETEIGIITEEAKKMFALRDLCTRNSDELMLAAKYERDKEKQTSMIYKSGNYRTLSTLWDALLWQTVYKQYPDALNKARVGIRKGFIAVSSDIPAHGGSDILRQLFGGGGFGFPSF